MTYFWTTSAIPMLWGWDPSGRAAFQLPFLVCIILIVQVLVSQAVPRHILGGGRVIHILGGGRVIHVRVKDDHAAHAASVGGIALCPLPQR